LQGILGGLRVTMLKDQIGIFHACVAQAFLALLVVIALVTTSFWRSLDEIDINSKKFAPIRFLAITITLAIYVQLALGATMRHQHRDLSILDFPLAYGEIIPDTSPARLAEINSWRDARALSDVTPGHIWLQLAHRFVAVLIAGGVIASLVLARKTAGHAGTLDPLASGLLPLALGEATKTVPFVMDGRKRYRFMVRWGEERDTDDTEGRVAKTSDIRPTVEDIRALLPQFTGVIEQTPPRYSAVKIQGERAYDLARDGEVVELAPRPVEIHQLDLIEQVDSSRSTFEAECGKGTYVRALARDMGRLLGCFGHICALRRTLVGPFGEADMIPLEQLEALCDRAASGEGSLADALLPVETALDDIPALAVTRADAARLHRGQAVLLRGRDAPNSSGTVYVTVAGRLLALAEIGNGELIPKRVFNLTGLTASPARNNESV